MKLTLNISLLLAVVMAVVLLLFEGVSLKRESDLLEADIRRDARLIAETLASFAARSVPSEASPEGVAELLWSVGRAEDEVHIAWRRADGSDAPALDAAGQQRLQQGELVVQEVRQGSHTDIIAWAPVRAPGGSLIGAVEVAESLAGRDAFLRRGLQTAGLVILGVTLLSGVTGLIAGRAVVGRRIEQLVQKTRQVARGELSFPVQLSGNDELNTLGHALNQMSDDLGRLRRHAEEEAGARLEAEVALQHADRLRTVGMLAAGIAHELGTPLNVIVGRSSLLERRAGADERIRTDARTIHQQADRITRFVRLLMDYSRQASPQVSTFDLAVLVRDQLELLSPQARRQRVSLRAHAPPDGLQVSADREQLTQVLTNLVLNAIHASPPDTAVDVSIVQGDDGEARLLVRDRGPGVPAELRERIFEPFYTTKAPGEGSGLGLSIVRRILRSHGATLTVTDAEDGPGAVFCVQLPGATP